MRNSFLQNKKLNGSVALWLGFHLVVIVGVLIRGSFAVNTDLFDILPPSHTMQSVAEADKIMSERSSRNVVILASHQDFSVAKQALEQLYAEFQGNPAFQSISLHFDASVVQQISDYIFAHRYSLLSPETVRLLNEGQGEVVANQALSTIYSPFILTGLDRLAQDPFMLTESRFQGFLSSSLAGSTAMSPKENILCAQWEGKWYLMLQGNLTKEATAITAKDGIIPALKTFAQTQEEAVPGLDLVFSGVPFHSFESSSNAQKEISLISTISLLVVLLILVLVFRSLLPVLVSMASIGLSALAATAAVLLFFGEMHIMALVFGTTLIGLGVDYSIHFFMAQRKGSAQNGKQALASIFRGVSFGFVSTQICFVLLFFAPFPILKQIAVFLSFGLASTYLSVVCLYQFLPPCKKGAVTRICPSLSGRIRRAAFAALFVLPLGILALRWQDITIENDLSQLYTMSAQLAHDEMTCAQVLDHGSAGWYYIVTGGSQDEVLRNEEALRAQLDREIATGNLSSYLATSLFVPSTESQRRSHQAAQQLAKLAPQHLAALGFTPQETAAFLADLHREPKPISMEGDLPPYIHNALGNLWLGELDGSWYSVVLPLHTSEEAVFRDIADSNSAVFFANLTKDVGRELNSLTQIMLILMAVALALILVVLKRWYSLKELVRIGCIPLCIFTTTMTTLSLCHIPVGFFSVAALLLVFGTGIDYIIYTLEAEKNGSGSAVPLAIFLSYGTTAMSFGALVFTSFAPVHIFGLTVLTGLSAAYIFSFLLRRQPSPKERADSGSAKGETAVTT